MFEALSYMDQQVEQQKQMAESAYHAQSIQQRTTDQEYDIKILLSEHSCQGNQCALITHNNNVYALVNFLPKNQKLTAKSDLATLTVKEMVQKIKNTFGLNNVQIADIVRVSRPSLYNHIAGKEVPTSLDSYQAFYDIAVQVEAKVGAPLKPGLKSILVNGKTLLTYLKERNMNPERIIYAAQEVSKKLAVSAGQTKIPASKQRETSHSFTKAG